MPVRSPTPRQRKAAKAIIENLLKKKPEPTGRVLEAAGYAAKSVEDTARIVLSEGVQAALQETGLKDALMRSGVTPEKIASKINLLLDARNKDGDDDFNAIDKGLRHATAIHGVIQDRSSSSSQTYNFVFAAGTQESVKEFEEKLKARILENADQA